MRHARTLLLLARPLITALAVAILLVELLWKQLGLLMVAFGRLPMVARLETAIGRLPPYAALVLFLVPWAVIVPVKLVALWLVALGRVFTGMLLFLLGEALGVGLLARLYELCRPSLLTLTWFARIERRVLCVDSWAHRFFESLPAVQRARAHIRRWRDRLAMTLRRAGFSTR